jgi:hypothetical protein
MLCKRATSSSLPSTVLSSSRLRVGYTVPSPSPDRAPAIVSISTMKALLQQAARPCGYGSSVAAQRCFKSSRSTSDVMSQPLFIGAYCQNMFCNRTHYPLASTDPGSLLHIGRVALRLTSYLSIPSRRLEIAGLILFLRHFEQQLAATFSYVAIHTLRHEGASGRT